MVQVLGNQQWSPSRADRRTPNPLALDRPRYSPGTFEATTWEKRKGLRFLPAYALGSLEQALLFPRLPPPPKPAPCSPGYQLRPFDRLGKAFGGRPEMRMVADLNAGSTAGVGIRVPASIALDRARLWVPSLGSVAWRVPLLMLALLWS